MNLSGEKSLQVAKANPLVVPPPYLNRWHAPRLCPLNQRETLLSLRHFLVPRQAIPRNPLLQFLRLNVQFFALAQNPLLVLKVFCPLPLFHEESLHPLLRIRLEEM